MSAATRADEEIKTDVVNQLYRDGRVDPLNIKVEVSEGEVILTGTVPNYAVYQAANEDAWSVSGVRYVRNDMTIKYPAGVKVPTDVQLRTNIENVLLWQPDGDSTDINVSVENGWITLRGNVDAFWKKVRTEELTLGLNGVLGITNELAIVPTKEFTDKTIEEDIEAAMGRDFNIDVDLIEVKVQNGKLTLTGSVTSSPAFRAVQRIAENTLGVLTVDNQLVIK